MGGEAELLLSRGENDLVIIVVWFYIHSFEEL